jgi:hypothetical protein
MSLSTRRTWRPFAYLAVVLGVTCIAVARLPESFVAVMRRGAVLSGAEADWALVLLLVAAVGQAAYGGFVVLHRSTLERIAARDPEFADLPGERAAAVVGRTAAAIGAVTLIYGGAHLLLTWQRGSFWAFAIVCAAQGAWYLREARVVGEWLLTRPAAAPKSQADPPYCPPLARRLTTEDALRVREP